MTNANFFTPTTKRLSLIELLEFYGLGLKVINYEQQLPEYKFFKKGDKEMPAFWKRLGFANDETIHSTTSHAEMSQVIKNYIAAHCTDAKEIDNGIYELNY